ncbi:histidine acid phosphatase [Ostertagia ostertagi]
MKQHMNFGKSLRETYIDKMKFLSPRYSSKEIYVRSTDRNRTIISAMSNILGMYGQKNKSAIADQDYPSDDGWPEGFVPVAVHTVDDDTDYVLNPGAHCDRQKKLWKMAKNSSEMKAFVAGLLAKLTELCGQEVHMENLWIIRDTLLVEQIHANETLRAVNKWFSDDLFNQMTVINHQIEAYQNGIFNGTLIMNNLDIGNEIQKIRAGSMINDINMHMNIKLQCMNKTSRGCKWINGLKYYVYSAHDTTLVAFFSAMGIQNKVISSSGYPEYSAAVLIELWRNRSDGQPYFMMKYHQNEVNFTLYNITHLIDPCKGRQYCSLDIFGAFANRTKPDLPMSEWCKVDPGLPVSCSTAWTLTVLTIFFCLLFCMWITS